MQGCLSQAHYTRRKLLTGFSAWGTLAALARRGDAQIQQASVQTRNSATACIFVNLSGAPSHLDTFDVKDAAWNAPDTSIAQAGQVTLNKTIFPNLARIGQDLCLLRSVVSWEAAHDRGQFYMQTSHPANPAFLAESPHIGAVVAYEMGKSSSKLPPFLAFNGAPRGATFLGGRNEPMSAPANQGGFSTITHPFFGNASEARFQQRFALLEKLDGEIRRNPHDRLQANHASFYTSAKGMMYDPVITEVFRFSADDNSRYGNTNFGRSCIVARNAVRSGQGASFINLTIGGWDMHQRMFDTGYPGNLYQVGGDLDRSIAMLVEDLKASGHFESTLIVMMGEFGRTPGALNVSGGRDHHKNAMCCAMLGGGVKGGRVIGATDANGAEVKDPGWSKQRPIYFEDITATIYSALGINWTRSLTETPSGRRFEYVPYASTGQHTCVQEVFG